MAANVVNDSLIYQREFWESDPDDTTPRRIILLENNYNNGDDDESFSPNDLKSRGHRTFVERGERAMVINKSRKSPGKEPPHAFDVATGKKEASILAAQTGCDEDQMVGIVHKNLSFPTSYMAVLDSPHVEGKKIRFADIVATDMEATFTLQDLHWREPSLETSDIDERENDCQWIESSLETVSHDDDDNDDDDESSTRSEESEEEKARIHQQLLFAVSGAGFVAFLAWGGRKLLDLFKKRVEDEEDDRAGGGYWANNQIEEHLEIQDAVKGRIKDAVKGMFTRSAAPGAVNGTLNG